MEEQFSDTDLMAYADGELDADMRAEIARAIEQDEALAARLAMFTRTRQSASEALEPLLEAPVPDALAISIAQMVERHETAASSATERAGDGVDNVVAFDRRPQRARAPRFDLALAASVALVAGGVIGYLASQWEGASAPSGIVTADLDNPGLPAALRTVPSGEETSLSGGDRFRAIASFRDEAGHVCREFELDGADASTLVSVACQTGGQWRVQFTVAAAGADDGYAPASSLEALDAYLAAIGAGEPLSADDERETLNRLP